MGAEVLCSCIFMQRTVLHPHWFWLAKVTNEGNICPKSLDTFQKSLKRCQISLKRYSVSVNSFRFYCQHSSNISSNSNFWRSISFKISFSAIFQRQNRIHNFRSYLFNNLKNTSKLSRFPSRIYYHVVPFAQIYNSWLVEYTFWHNVITDNNLKSENELVSKKHYLSFPSCLQHKTCEERVCDAHEWGSWIKG